MDGDGCEIVVGTLEQAIRSDAAIEFTCNPVALAIGIFGTVDEESLFNGAKIAADLKHLLQKENGALFQLAHAFAERAVTVDVDHLADTVKAVERLTRRIDGIDVEIVPRDIASLIRRDR